MAYFIGSLSGATTLGSTSAEDLQSYDPVFDESVDLDFIWNILPSAYRELMEDREVFTQAWNAMLRGLAGRFLDTWQTAAAFSLKNLPLHQQRKWLKYSFVQEQEFESDPGLTASGLSEHLQWDEDSYTLSGIWKNRYGHDRFTTGLRGEVSYEGSLSWSVCFSYSSAEKFSGVQFGYFNSSVRKRISNAIVCGAVGDTNAKISPFVGQYDANGLLTFSVSAYAMSPDVEYDFSAEYDAASSVLSLELYELDAVKTSGTGATGDSGGLYTAEFIHTGADFGALGVEAGDILIIDSDRYEIDEASGDTITVVSASLPAGVSGVPYSIEGRLLRDTTTLDLQAEASDPQFTVDEFGTSNLDLRRIQNGDSTPVCLYITSDPIVGRRQEIEGYIKSWEYLDPTVEEDVLSVPRLQDAVTDPSFYLYEGTDYEIVDNTFHFRSVPSEDLWAEYSTYDEGVMYANFGANVGLEGTSGAVYRSQIRGLYYAYFRGPTPAAIRTGVQILLNLPISGEAGTVESINPAYSGEYGQIVISGKNYLYPLDVGTTLNIGDEVPAYHPLCGGVEIQDYITHPRWWEDFSVVEVEKYHTFAVFLDVDAFDLDDLAAAGAFVDTIKPTWKDSIFVVYKELEDSVDLDDEIAFDWTLHLYDIPGDAPPLVAFDDAIFEGEEADWRFDQGLYEWGSTSPAMRYGARTYNSAQLQVLYGDDAVRPYLTGEITLLNGSKVGSGSSSLWTTEVGSGALTDVFVLLALYTSGSDGVTTAGSQTFTDTVTGFSDLVAGDSIEIDGVEYEIQSIETATSLTLDAAAAASGASLSWSATGKLNYWAEIATVTGDTALEFNANCGAPSGVYRMSLLDPNYKDVFIDQFVEEVPDEQACFVAEIIPGYNALALTGTATFDSASTTVMGSGTSWLSEIVGGVPYYIVDPNGNWHAVALVVADNQLTLGAMPPDDLVDVPIRFAENPAGGAGILSNSIIFNNGSPNAVCGADMSATGTGELVAGDWIQAVPGTEPVVQIQSIAGVNITLTENYSGNSGAWSVLLRGPSSVMPKSIVLPTGTYSFTDWFDTDGGEITDCVPELIPANLDSGWVELTDAHSSSYPTMQPGSGGGLGGTLSYSSVTGWTISGTPPASTNDGGLEGDHLPLDNLPFDVQPGDILLVKITDWSSSLSSWTIGVGLADSDDGSGNNYSGIGYAERTSPNATGIVYLRNAYGGISNFNKATSTELRGAVFTDDRSIVGGTYTVEGSGSGGIQSDTTVEEVTHTYPQLIVTTHNAVQNAGSISVKFWVRRIRIDWSSEHAHWREITDAHASGTIQDGLSGDLGASLSYSEPTGWTLSGTPAAVLADGVSEGESLLMDHHNLGMVSGDILLTSWEGIAPSGLSSWILSAGNHGGVLSTDKGVAGGFSADGSTVILPLTQADTTVNIGPGVASPESVRSIMQRAAWRSNVIAVGAGASSAYGSIKTITAPFNDMLAIHAGTRDTSQNSGELTGRLWVQKLSIDWTTP